MKATIEWLNKNVHIEKRVFLFCFQEKCMSGKIRELMKLNDINKYEIFVDFIEPYFFKDEVKEGNVFTINEASKILAKGKVD